jgi:hypothetical protein
MVDSGLRISMPSHHRQLFRFFVECPGDGAYGPHRGPITQVQVRRQTMITVVRQLRVRPTYKWTLACPATRRCGRRLEPPGNAQNGVHVV